MSATVDDPLLQTVLRGLSAPQKTLPPTLFYDEVGSALFDQITTLDEYYLTRAEAEILEVHGPAIARALAEGATAVVMIEPGCGSGGKAQALLRHLPARAYVGVDVSTEALRAGAARLQADLPGLDVIAIEADYHQDLCLPALPEGRRVVFFPGSTIGNFDPGDAANFLRRLRDLAGPQGRLVLGVDLWKPIDQLTAAYDDRAGVTAAFDKNALAHLNARYNADFDLDRFDHFARVDPLRRRVEMHLRAREAHAFTVAGRRFRVDRGETLHTESSYKYEVADVRALAERGGLAVLAHWTDAEAQFGVFALAPLEAG
jgi:dimethylhistidine N-methyltransferase